MVKRVMAMDGMAQTAWVGEMESWFAFGAAPEASGLASAERGPGMVCVWWLDEPGRMENNLVISPDEAGDPDVAFASLGERLDASRAATDLRLPAEGGVAAWVSAAQRRGFVLEGVDPIMASDLTERACVSRMLVRVVPADDTGTHDRAADVIEAVWGDPGICRFFAPPSATRLFLAERDGRSIGAATTFRCDDLVCIFSVTTLPKYRKQGVAHALLHGIAEEERARGAQWAIVRTVDGLVSFYEHAGFRTVIREQRYRRPAIV